MWGRLNGCELRRLQSAQALVDSVPIMDVPDVLVVHVFSDVLERLHLAERMIEELEKFPTQHSQVTRKNVFGYRWCFN